MSIRILPLNNNFHAPSVFVSERRANGVLKQELQDGFTLELLNLKIEDSVKTNQVLIAKISEIIVLIQSGRKSNVVGMIANLATISGITGTVLAEKLPGLLEAAKRLFGN